MEDHGGYRGSSQNLLARAGAKVGDVVQLEANGQSIRGTLAPRYQHDDDAHVVIKLENGYNLGISVGKISKLKKLSAGEKPAFTTSAPKLRTELPEVSILGTGGTIASRVDYRTGAVRPAISSEDLYSLIPELSDIARISPEIVVTASSENLEPGDWARIAQRVADGVARGVRGVVVTTGTDVMGYTTAALALALQKVPIPVLVVGSQRSSDRPSSDAYLNLVGAVSLAVSAEFSGVYVVMHADWNDEKLAVHSGTRVRKNHTSTRDAFQSIGEFPVAYWTRAGLQLVSKGLPPRSDGSRFRARTKFDPNVVLVKFYPSMPTPLLEAVIGRGLRGLVIEGTGLGHINSKNIATVATFVKGGGIACMTSQCIWGRVDMNVYDNGRDLLRAGVLPLEDMLAETALVKLMWVLGNSSSPGEVKSLMLENLAGEILDRSISDASSK